MRQPVAKQSIISSMQLFMYGSINQLQKTCHQDNMAALIVENEIGQLNYPQKIIESHVMVENSA